MYTYILNMFTCYMAIKTTLAVKVTSTDTRIIKLKLLPYTKLQAI